MQNIDRIFEPYFTTKGAHGTGLGLWIARTIVQRLGGSIRVRSCARPEKSGTCFFGFPAQPTAKLDLTYSRWNQGAAGFIIARTKIRQFSSWIGFLNEINVRHM